ncbi:Major facilitator superfamily domain general substrate transporter [Penicillium hispanicum]|uniref:Major facilitator superfamily domain general substrate transporter n=1 Tax=Penicillium hispanicum TaxID=1080232 RepID=UPI00254057B3|nr:Major facilitator superfamily domain general substrate transporter [Penicillium hispanicum]KAJ5579644.1 Major facilitator superfamily domain general substrate transporter [Penicillium hispanicum]
MTSYQDDRMATLSWSLSDSKDSTPSFSTRSFEKESFGSSRESVVGIIDEEKLPPMDGGLHAWLFLLASAMLEALVWGYAFAYGIFQDYYSAHEPFKGSGNIAVIGTCAMGLAYMIAPLAIVMMILVPRIARWVSTIGVVIMCLSLALSSFASNVTHLILSQGIGFGIGGCLAYTPSILYMSEWFDKRKGLAFGIVWAGSGLSGVIFPLVLEWLLEQYGIETTLRVSGVALFILAAPFLYFHRPRLPPSTAVNHHRLNFHFLYNKVYMIYQIGNTVEALGFFLPTLYLPSFARSLGASEFVSSLTVTLVNLASVFSCVFVGFLTDRYHVTTCLLISTVGTVLSVFFIWGFATSIPTLFVFCVAYGLLAGGFSSTWSGISQEVQRANPEADATVIFPFMETGRGIGNVVSGPLSEVLLKADHGLGGARGAYGSGYGSLVLCTGMTALVGGVSVVARYFRWV